MSLSGGVAGREDGVFEVLDAAEADQRATWIAAWQSWPGREVSAHPAYVRLFARPGDRALCAFMAGPDGAVLFPFVLRPLCVEPWGAVETGRWDLTSPYGYGGAFAWGRPEPNRFWAHFDKWASHVGVVCSFVRLSLFAEHLIPFVGEVQTRDDNVVRTLDVDPDVMWMEYEHKVRKSVKRAQRSGVRVDPDPDGGRLEEFLAIYYSTMERREASQGYYFSREFFRSLVENLSEQVVFFHAIHGEKVVSTELVLISAERVYSFLGGTDARAFDLRPNDLLKHTIIGWGREQGKKSYVLGGGYRNRDGIFRYKTSFAPNGVVPFKIGTRIYDREAYERLIEARRQWEVSGGVDWHPRDSFFPAYRS